MPMEKSKKSKWATPAVIFRGLDIFVPQRLLQDRQNAEDGGTYSHRTRCKCSPWGARTCRTAPSAPSPLTIPSLKLPRLHWGPVTKPTPRSRPT